MYTIRLRVREGELGERVSKVQTVCFILSFHFSHFNLHMHPNRQILTVDSFNDAINKVKG